MTPTRTYRALSWLLAPVLLGHLAWRAARDGGSRYLRERLGFCPRHPPAASPRRWVHAASVGEVMTVLPLVAAVAEREPEATSGMRSGAGSEMRFGATSAAARGTGAEGRAAAGRAERGGILVTTNTPTGAAVLARHAPPGVEHAYLPIDRPGATRRFLERARPASGWIVETEIWPWLYAGCRAREVPLTIVNARVSPTTRRHAHGPLAATYRHALDGVEVLARSATDAAGYRALGAGAARTHLVGELKFAGEAGAPPPAPIDRRYALAASTHEDEEERLARAWLARGTDELLVLAPRHPERGAALARRLAAADGRSGRGDGLGRHDGRRGPPTYSPTYSPACPPACRRRGIGERPGALDRLYLADTLGELDAWYAHARGVFVGGSLVPRGGHNVLEPARRGRAIVVGPHTANFAEAMAVLRAARAVTEANDADAVVEVLLRALSGGDAALDAQARRALDAARDAGRVVDAYLARLDER